MGGGGENGKGRERQGRDEGRGGRGMGRGGEGGGEGGGEMPHAGVLPDLPRCVCQKRSEGSMSYVFPALWPPCSGGGRVTRLRESSCKAAEEERENRDTQERGGR